MCRCHIVASVLPPPHQKLNLGEIFVSEFARIILRLDRHGGLKIHKREWPTFTLRLKIQLEPFGKNKYLNLA